MIPIAAMVGAPDLTQDTLAIYRDGIPSAISKLATYGYDGIEIMVRDPSCLDGKTLRRQLQMEGLRLAGLCTGHVYGEEGLGLVGSEPDICMRAMQRLKSFIDFAGEYGDWGTVVNIGRSRGTGIVGDPEGTLQRMEESFRELAEYAAPSGVRLVLEPINCHQASYIHTTQEGIQMVRRVGHPNFGLMLDVYHMNIEDDNIEQSFRDAREFCWFIHFADNHRRYPSSGHIDFRSIVNVLEEIGYQGFVSLEILPLPDPDTAALSAINFLHNLMRRCSSNGS